MLNELKNGRKVVGAKQTRRALGDGSAQRVIAHKLLRVGARGCDVFLQSPFFGDVLHLFHERLLL